MALFAGQKDMQRQNLQGHSKNFSENTDISKVSEGEDKTVGLSLSKP